MDEISKSISNFLSFCKFEKNLAPLTLKAYTIDLKQFAGYLSNLSLPDQIEFIDKVVVRDYLKFIFDRYKPKSLKRKIATLKAYMNFLECEDYITVSPFRKLRIKIHEGKKLPKTIDFKNISKLFKFLYNLRENSSEAHGMALNTITRDIAVLELLFASGMRVAELSTLSIKNINFNKESILIKGKGNRERIIPIVHASTIKALTEYYQLFRPDLSNGTYFFVNRLNHRLSEQSIRLMIRKYARKSKIPHVTPHMFRHSVATLLLENGVDIRFIQNILGHSSINTTQIYAQVNEAPKRRVLRLKHPRNKMSF
jgi:integrase/recombinase XerD